MSYKETGKRVLFGGLMYKGREEEYIQCLTENKKQKEKTGRAEANGTSGISFWLF